jgi:ribose/xylose/arabinose/galactoside ABC-type transport system permease subunit
MKILLRKYSLLIIFVVILISTTLSTKDFLSLANIGNILRQFSIVGMLSIGETLIILTGGIDLSIGSLVALSSVLCATFMPHSIFLSVFMTILVCTLLGLVNGFLVAKAQMAPFIVTLGMMMIGRGMAILIAKGLVVPGVSESFYVLYQGSVLGFPLPTIILIVILFIMYFVVSMTGWGRHIYSIGGNEEVTRLAGINVDRIKMAVYTFSGFFAGLAGLIFTARVTAGFPDSAVGYELNAIAAVIIGGVNLFGGEGNLLKVMVGVLILTIISNFMNLAGISPYTQDAVKGGIILLAVFLSLRR